MCNYQLLIHYYEFSLFCKIAAQGKISELVSEIYSIKYDFMGRVVSNMARVRPLHVLLPCTWVQWNPTKLLHV